jgi:hypothetical protein
MYKYIIEKGIINLIEQYKQLRVEETCQILCGNNINERISVKLKLENIHIITKNTLIMFRQISSNLQKYAISFNNKNIKQYERDFKMIFWTFDCKENFSFLNCNMKPRYNNIKKYKIKTKINTRDKLCKLLEKYNAKEYYVEMRATVWHYDDHISQKEFEIAVRQLLPKEITNFIICLRYRGDHSEFILRIHKKLYSHI